MPRSYHDACGARPYAIRGTPYAVRRTPYAIRHTPYAVRTAKPAWSRTSYVHRSYREAGGGRALRTYIVMTTYERIAEGAPAEPYVRRTYRLPRSGGHRAALRRPSCRAPAAIVPRSGGHRAAVRRPSCRAPAAIVPRSVGHRAVLRRPSRAGRPSSRRSRATARAGRGACGPRRAALPSGLPTRRSRACSRACRVDTARARP
jgi:hypothetical protein